MDNRSRNVEVYHRDRRAGDARASVNAGSQLQSYSRPSRAVKPVQGEFRRTTTTTVRYQECDNEDDDEYSEDEYSENDEDEDKYEDDKVSASRSVVSRRPNTRMTTHTVATEVCRPGRYAPVLSRAVATQMSGRVTRRGITADIRARGYDAEIETDLGNGNAMVMRQRKHEYESRVVTDTEVIHTQVTETKRTREYKRSNYPYAIQYDGY